MASEYIHSEQSISYILFDWQDGNGWQDVSEYVKWDTIEIQEEGLNQNYRHVQSSATFDLIYDETIYNKLASQTDDVLVTINMNGSLEDYTNLVGIARVGVTYLVNGTVGFTGRFKPFRNRTYNGIVDNMMISVDATDSSHLLDKPIGDIIYENYKVFDPTDTANSIVHQLALVAGFTLDKVSPICSITDVVPVFAPPKTDASILKTLDDLFFEHGYTLNFDSRDRIACINWLGNTTPVFTFDDCNMKLETTVSYQDRDNKYKGIAVKYYELGTRANTLVYRDSKLPYGDREAFAGYDILAGFRYPPEANGTDPGTGDNYMVKQKYTNDGIEYFTNEAVAKGIEKEYYYKAFKSDFSDIIKTTNHRLEKKWDSGIVLEKNDYGNKEAEILLLNNTAGPLKVYYLNVYADVTYRTTSREVTRNVFNDGDEYQSYTLAYIYTQAQADTIADRLASDMAIGRIEYSLLSSNNVLMGSPVHISMGDGTEQDCIVVSRSYSESDGKYEYLLVGIGAETQSKGATSTVDAPVGSQGEATTHVPRYVGGFTSDDLALTNAVPTMKMGDWYLYTGTTDASRTKGKVYRWSTNDSNGNAVWTEVTTKDYIAPAIEDAMALADGTVDTIQIAEDWADAVILNKLFVEKLGAQSVSVSSNTGTGPKVELLKDGNVGLKVNDGTSDVLRAYVGATGSFGAGDVVIGDLNGPSDTSNAGVMWDNSASKLILNGDVSYSFLQAPTVSAGDTNKLVYGDELFTTITDTQGGSVGTVIATFRIESIVSGSIRLRWQWSGTRATAPATSRAILYAKRNRGGTVTTLGTYGGNGSGSVGGTEVLDVSVLPRDLIYLTISVNYGFKMQVLGYSANIVEDLSDTIVSMPITGPFGNV